MTHSLPKFVKVVEVGPRDGLQNEATILPVNVKIDFINKLCATGLKNIEVGSFVSPKWVPQMADSAEVFDHINKSLDTNFSVLVPNERGLQQALEHRVKEIAVFTAASETFVRKNINCSIDESLQRFEQLISRAKQHQLKIRGYISCVLGCPYEGEISPSSVVYVAQKLFQMGCTEISLGDTIGVGTPLTAQKLIQEVSKVVPIQNLAVHFHDTYGLAITNIFTVLQQGVHIVDSSVAGLGGCPYAVGASGNVATEDVIYLLHSLGIETGVDLEKVCEVGNFISRYLQRPNRSKVGVATMSNTKVAYE